MTLKAPPEFQKLGQSAEEDLFHRVAHGLAERRSAIFVWEGSSDSKENGEFGDCLLSASSWEAPLVTLELKGSTRPLSFSLSDYEKRCSIARWVLVRGPMGVWAVMMDVARQHLTERQGERGEKYWTSQPPYDQRARFQTVLDDIQIIFGELKP